MGDTKNLADQYRESISSLFEEVSDLMTVLEANTPKEGDVYEPHRQARHCLGNITQNVIYFQDTGFNFLAHELDGQIFRMEAFEHRLPAELQPSARVQKLRDALNPFLKKLQNA